MDREGFRNRMKQYKKAREENPGLKYWEWKNVPKYDEGGEVTVPTEEEFLNIKKKNLNDYELKNFDPWIRFFGERDHILDQIRKRTNEDAFTQKRRFAIAEKYTAPFIKDKEIVLTNSGNLTGAKLSENLLDSLYKYSDVVGIPVQDAIGLAAQETTFGKFHGLMDPKDKISVLAATGNPEHGFDPIESLHNHSYEEDAYYDPANEVRRWLSRKYPNIKEDALTELAADELENNPNYYINEGVKRYNAIENPWVHAFNVYKSGKYNSNDKRHTADVQNAGKLVMQDPAIKKWAQEKGIAFAEGTDGVLESYYNPTTVEGVLAKTALQLADPTGVSSYPDVWYSGKEFLKSPSWAKLGDVGLNTLSALPLIGKVTAPFKAAKMAKLLTRIEDANALVKGVEKANRLNRAIDTVPELLPVVRRGAEKVQDVTSSLITNPMFNYISNQNKFDLVRNYRNVNAAVDAVNVSNNTADLTQGMGTLLGYGDGGEVTGPPTYEQWDADMNQYNPTILDNASMYWSIEAAKKALHNEAMKLPGYAERWTEYYRSLPKNDTDINEFVDELWANENPNNAGLKNGKYYPHKSPEGGKPTIGPGFKLDSGSHGISAKTANRGMTKTRLDQEARKIGKQHLKAVDQFINYGQTTNPADTVSPQIKMGLMDLRHQVGPLNEWGNLRQAVLNGDLEGIRKESTVTWNDNGKTKVDKRRKKIRDEKYFYYE